MGGVHVLIEVQVWDNQKVVNTQWETTSLTNKGEKKKVQVWGNSKDSGQHRVGN